MQYTFMDNIIDEKSWININHNTTVGSTPYEDYISNIQSVWKNIKKDGSEMKVKKFTWRTNKDGEKSKNDNGFMKTQNKNCRPNERVKNKKINFNQEAREEYIKIIIEQ